MQNIVYERKQNGEDFFSLPAVTYFCFGNCPANGLVTEQPQYSVAVCIFSTWQNAETKLISNGLRFIFTCPLFLAQPITFHWARHTWATIAHKIEISKDVISLALGHEFGCKTTGIYIDYDLEQIDKANRKVIDYINSLK